MPVATVFADKGEVLLMLRERPDVIEFGGELVPAVTMTPAQARELALSLCDFARDAEK